MTRDQVVESIIATCKDEPDIIALYLFGSYAHGTQNDKSDVDVAILLDNFKGGTLASLRLDLQADLELALKIPVDLIVLNSAPVDLAQRVIHKGLVLIDTDRAQRIRFEVDVRRRYFDLLPYIQEYRRGAA